MSCASSSSPFLKARAIPACPASRWCPDGRQEPVAHQLRHGADEEVLPWRWRPRPASRVTTCQKCIRTAGYRQRRQHRPPRHLFRDAGQLLLRRLLQARSHRLGLGIFDPGAGDPGGPPVGVHLSRTTTRRTTSGPNEVGVDAGPHRPPGQGRQLLGASAPAPAAPAPRSTLTAATKYGCGKTAPAASAATATGTWRSGTWCSPSSTATARATTSC